MMLKMKYWLSALCIVFLIFIYPIECNTRSLRYNDMCGIMNGRRLYLEMGERGIVSVKNTTVTNNFKNDTNGQQLENDSNLEHCTLELVTCASCIITVEFSFINITRNCSKSNFTSNDICPCDYVWLSEPPYEEISGKAFCGTSEAPQMTYQSQVRSLSITFFYKMKYTHAFSFQYTVERNRQFIKGSSGYVANQNYSQYGEITSPFFPALYPRDIIVEYIITCDVEANINCYIQLIFNDFQLGTMSFMEFYDWNGQRLDVTSGALFRPPVILSSGPSLLVRFHGNTGSGLGFKATYSFLTTGYHSNDISPSTDCGGYVENLGGAITMMNMIEDGTRSYDCIWIIRLPKNYISKSHLYIKVVDFSSMAEVTQLTVRQGMTSNKPVIEILRYPTSVTQNINYIEHVTTASTGFYIRLKAVFTPKSRLAISYSAFNYKDCFVGADFLCRNHRCIPIHLSCDGFDHCGDNSDEPQSCYQNWNLDEVDHKWYSHTPNYYFPKIDRYPDLKTATMVFIVSSLGLIALISALVLLLYRMGSRARQQREIQDQLQTISNLLDGNRNDDLDDPPVYESPPGYDEVIKVGMIDVTDQKHKRRRSTKRTRDSRSRSRSYSKKRKSTNKIPTEPIPNDDLAVPSTSQNVTNSNRSNEISKKNSPPPTYLATITSGPYLHSAMLSEYFDSLMLQNQSNSNLPKSLTSKLKCKSWLQTHGSEIANSILGTSKKNTSNFRRCLSQDDMLNMSNIKSTTEEENDKPKNVITMLSPKRKSAMHESASDSNLSSFNHNSEIKDNKKMKNVIEHLFARTKNQRKSYQAVSCNCQGACSCSTNGGNEIRVYNSNSEATSSNGSPTSPITVVKIEDSIKDADERLLLKTKYY